MIIRTAGLLMIQDRRLLLTYSSRKKAWYLPGGKIDRGETPEQALIREIEEELGVELQLDLLRHCYHITAPAFGESNGVIMEQDCFMHPIDTNIHPNNEIEAIRYFSLEEYLNEPQQVVGVITAFEYLKKDNLI